MKPIIKVENISKQYHIGARQPQFTTLRDSLSGILQAPLNLFRHNGHSEENTIWALKDVSFNVMPGEAIGIIGNNGAGKSTLLKILSRITEPTRGQIDLYGRIGSLLEVGTGFHPELTGRENIYLNGSILGLSRKEINRKFGLIVDFSEIEAFIDTPVKRYSSGMYVRLAFAVAAHLEPEVLVIDEVLAVGDIAFQKKCLGKMGEATQRGQTVILVSHNLPTIQRLCDRVILLEAGRVTDYGPTSDVISRYLQRNTTAAMSWHCQSSLMKTAHFKKVYVCDEEGREAEYVTTATALRLALEFEISEKTHNLQLSVGLLDANGDQIFGSSSQDGGVTAPKEPGLYSAIVCLPPELLLPKTYGIRAALWEPERGGIDIIDPISFTVQETASLNNSTPSGRPGHIAIRCGWSINHR